MNIFSKITSIFSSKKPENNTKELSLKISTDLKDFLENEVLPGLDINADTFWKSFELIVKEFTPRTLMTSCIEKIIKFQANHETIIVKPLDGMGGDSIYKMENIEEENLDILLDMTEEETTQIVVQEFLPEIYKGDFRILVIHLK